MVGTAAPKFTVELEAVIVSGALVITSLIAPLLAAFAASPEYTALMECVPAARVLNP